MKASRRADRGTLLSMGRTRMLRHRTRRAMRKRRKDGGSFAGQGNASRCTTGRAGILCRDWALYQTTNDCLGTPRSSSREGARHRRVVECAGSRYLDRRITAEGQMIGRHAERQPREERTSSDALGDIRRRRDLQWIMTWDGRRFPLRRKGWRQTFYECTDGLQAFGTPPL
jgi:hypothetical protein